jgi:hypothetical protein
VPHLFHRFAVPLPLKGKVFGAVEIFRFCRRGMTCHARRYNFRQHKTNAKTHLRPSSVTCGDTFSQREKAFGLCRTKGFSLREKLAAKRTDEGRGTMLR